MTNKRKWERFRRINKKIEMRKQGKTTIPIFDNKTGEVKIQRIKISPAEKKFYDKQIKLRKLHPEISALKKIRTRTPISQLKPEEKIAFKIIKKGRSSINGRFIGEAKALGEKINLEEELKKRGYIQAMTGGSFKNFNWNKGIPIVVHGGETVLTKKIADKIPNKPPIPKNIQKDIIKLNKKIVDVSAKTGGNIMDKKKIPKSETITKRFFERGSISRYNPRYRLGKESKEDISGPINLRKLENSLYGMQQPGAAKKVKGVREELEKELAIARRTGKRIGGSTQKKIKQLKRMAIRTEEHLKNLKKERRIERKSRFLKKGGHIGAGLKYRPKGKSHWEGGPIGETISSWASRKKMRTGGRIHRKGGWYGDKRRHSLAAKKGWKYRK